MWAFPKSFSSYLSQGVFLPTVAFGLFTGKGKVAIELFSIIVLFFLL